MTYKSIDSDLLARMFKRGTYQLNLNKDLVDALNVYPVPDGDTGTNMSLTMTAATQEIFKKDHETIYKVAKAVSKGSLMGARGNSGVILSQIFRGFAKACEDKEELTVIDMAEAFKQAAETAYSAVLKPVEGTILTVIREVGEKAMSIADEDMLLHHFFKIILEHANETLDRTPEFLDVLKQAGVVDAGGKGLICILDGFYEAIMNQDDEDLVAPQVIAPQVEHAQPDLADIKFAYCTEFIVRGADLSHSKLKEKIIDMGDSMVYVADDDMIKVHIHTNNPGKVMEYALEDGELLKIKIENMKEQHSEIVNQKPKTPETMKKYGFITVAMGDGIASIFEDLKIDQIIRGGQTMNPSTEDILKAIDQIHAEEIFILPNNSNIILAANQAKELSDKPLHVIPSKTIPQGITALVEFNQEADSETNVERMIDALGDVKTIQMTYAVRDTQFNDLEIKKDNILGVTDGDITAVGEKLEDVIYKVLDKAMDEDSEIFTIYYGDQIEKETAEALAEAIEEKYEELEVEVYNGGQPLYYYIFSIE